MISLAGVMCTFLCIRMWTIPSDGISSLKQRAFLVPEERERHGGQVKLQISSMEGNDNEVDITN